MEIYAVKAATKDIYNFHLQDVGLKGIQKVTLENGAATFSALKFKTTSYNNDVIYINFILNIHEKTECYNKILFFKIE